MTPRTWGWSLNSASIFWSASPVPQTGLLGRVFGERIAALDHKALDDAVEAGAVVKAGLRQFLEILNRLGRGIGPKLDDHIPFRRADHGHFLFWSGGCGHRRRRSHGRGGGRSGGRGGGADGLSWPQPAKSTIPDRKIRQFFKFFIMRLICHGARPMSRRNFAKITGRGAEDKFPILGERTRPRVPRAAPRGPHQNVILKL